MLSWDELKSLGEVVVYDRTDSNDIIARAADADAVLVNKVVLDEKTLKSLPKLKYVGVLATGYNVVDVAAAAECGVTVTNIPAYSTDSVVQMTFAHILNITNRVAHYARLNREGRWSSNKDFCYWDTPLPELSGLTLGIVGLGNIGMKVANIARNFGMEVYADTSKNSASLPEGIQKTTFEGLLGVCDILTLHCPLTDKTRELVNAETHRQDASRGNHHKHRPRTSRQRGRRGRGAQVWTTVSLWRRRDVSGAAEQGQSASFMQ